MNGNLTSIRNRTLGMKAIMLVAGTGIRLGQLGMEPGPKVLLRFGGKSLLQRHIEILKRTGVQELVLGVGYQQEKIMQEIADLRAENFVKTVYNEDYELGNIVTLWTLREELAGARPALLMDGDILYDERIIQRLVASRHEDSVLLDRSSVLDDEQVKLCIRNGEVVEFRKWLSTDYDFCGESVGIFKLSPHVAQKLIAQTQLYIEQARRTDPYEEALRDVMLTSPRGTFAYEDITGLPWIEIDFPKDIERAKSEILPRMVAVESDGPSAAEPGKVVEIVH